MPYLKLLAQDKLASVHEITERCSIGRALDNDITLDDPTISQHHALILERDGLWLVEDCGSTNGILTESGRVDNVVLTEGSRFSVGAQGFEFCLQLTEQFDKTLKIKKSWIPGVYYTE